MQLVVRQSPEQDALSLIQKHFPEYHPLIALSRLAHRPDVMQDPKLELEVHKAILPYVTPKLSSVEVKPAGDDRRRVVISLFEEDLDVEDVEGRPVVASAPLLAEAHEIVPLDAE